MIRFKTEQTIARPAGEVWAFAADVTHHPEWMGVTDAYMISGRPTEVGARARERMKLGPRKLEVEFEVSGSVPAERIAWRMAGSGPFSGEVSLDLESLGPDVTRTTWSGAIGLTGWWRLLEPLMAGDVASGEAAELRRLKERLETPTTSTVQDTA